MEAGELAKVKAVEGSSVAERGDRWGKVLSPCAATDTDSNDIHLFFFGEMGWR